MTSGVPRRSFLKTAGITLGAGIIVCGGGSFLATRNPISDLSDYHFGEITMSKKILVAYASKSGMTVPMAAAIGEAVSASGALVDVLPIKDGISLDSYDAAIIGSSIRMGSWLPEAKKFVEANQATLNNLPTAIFTTHMLNRDESAESVAARAAYVAPILELLNPSEVAFFAGAMELAKLSFFEKTLSRMMKAEDEDLRDFEALKAWGQRLGETLTV